MNENIKNICDLITENRDALEQKMFWEIDKNTYAIMAGLLTAASGVKADPDRYQECKDILKKNANVFSELRGLAGALVAVKMMPKEDPEAYIKGVSEVYKKLRDIHKLTASPYMVMAAMNIYDHNGVEFSDADIERLEELYKELKKQHPLLISDADRSYLSMLATSDMDIKKTAKLVEDAYEVCKKLSLDKEAVHSMSQVLAFSNKSAEEKYEFVDGIIKGLNENDTPISKDKGLSVLGALALLDIPKEQLITDITDASNYLKGHKGFKWYNEGTRMRTVYAALAVLLAYAKDNESLGKVISSNLSMNIAEEIVMLLIAIIIVSSMATSMTAGSSK